MNSTELVMAGSYDLRLVALSVFIAVLASYAALDLAGRVTSARDWARTVWLSCGATAMGIGLWSMHYVGMLAFRLPVPVQYDWPTELISLIAAIIASVIALFVVSRSKMGFLRSVVGSIFMGGAIAGMHYIGMAAMRLPGLYRYSRGLVTISVILSMVISLLALWLAFHFRGETRSGGWRKALSAVVMGAAVPVIHYSGMAAASFTPSLASNGNLTHALSISSLGTTGVIFVTFVVLGLTVVTSLVDRGFSEQALEFECSEKRSRQILETALDAFVGIDSRGTIVDWNAQATATFGWSRQESLGQLLSNLIIPERDRANYEKGLQQFIASCEGPVLNKRIELTAQRRDRREFPVEVTISTMQWGRTHQYTVFLRDITARKELEKSLRISEERTRAILDRIEDGCFEVELSDEGCYLFVNKGFCEITGYSADEMLGKSFREFFDAETSRQLNLAYRRVYETEEPLKAFEYALIRKDGTKRYVEESVSLKKGSQGQPVAFIGIRRDCTERKLAEEKLRISEERYRAILEQIEDGYFEVDLGGHFQLVNDGYCRMLRCSPNDVLGKSYKEVVPPHQIPMIKEVFHKVYQTGNPVKSFEYETLRRDRSAVVVEDSICLRKDRHGKPFGFHGIVRDITERKRIEKELAAAKDAAEAASRAKSTFLATMSHEIRTPMNGILGMTELVLDTDLTVEQREHLGLVRLSAESLLSVINDILDFSKIEAGKLELESIPFDLRESIGETMKSLSFRAHQKGLELVYEVQPDVPEPVLGDPSRIRQILVNLIGNAIKFTEQGEVFVNVEEESHEAGVTHMHFSVKDTGVGIPAEKQEKIFEAFSQADGSMARKYGGSGLGLTICTRLVAMMGGGIWVESQAGEGSTFHFTLRMALQDAPAQRVAPVQPEQLHDMHALIVDDNFTNRRVLNGMLTRWGMKPTAVEGGRAALQALEIAKSTGHPFPLILLDGQMPEMDGFALAELIKKDPELVGATIMMLTSAGHLGDAARCRELGISAYLVKPIRQGELLEAICNVLNKAQQKEAPLITRHTMREAKNRVRVLLAEDNAVNRTLAVRLLEKRGYVVTATGSGREALAALEIESADIVLMDIQMPDMDGFEATAAIREKEKSTGMHIPIIAMTAHALKGDQERCLAAGMDGYISKPIRTSELFTTMESVLSGNEALPLAQRGQDKEKSGRRTDLTSQTEVQAKT
jgi:PAS domain S-box-containing protein